MAYLGGYGKWIEPSRKVIEDNNTEALARLEAMADSEAAPDIALLDALVQSLQVDQTGQ